VTERNETVFSYIFQEIKMFIPFFCRTKKKEKVFSVDDIEIISVSLLTAISYGLKRILTVSKYRGKRRHGFYVFSKKSI
jgi:hypothetical protein